MRLCQSEPKEEVGRNGGCLTGGTRVDLKVGTEREWFESESESDLKVKVFNSYVGCMAMFSVNWLQNRRWNKGCESLVMVRWNCAHMFSKIFDPLFFQHNPSHVQPDLIFFNIIKSMSCQISPWNSFPKNIACDTAIKSSIVGPYALGEEIEV